MEHRASQQNGGEPGEESGDEFARRVVWGGREAGVSDQTVLNIEQASNPQGAVLGTLLRMARQYGVRLSEVVAEGEWGANGYGPGLFRQCVGMVLSAESGRMWR